MIYIDYMLNLLAVDPSLSSTGVVIFHDGAAQGFYTIKTKPPKKAMEDVRLQQIAGEFTGILEKENPTILVIESQYLGVNVNSMSKVIEVKGLLKGLFIAYCSTKGNFNYKIVDVTPLEAKQVLGIKTRLKRLESKAAVKAALCRMFPTFYGLQEDVLDAIAIGLAGQCKLNIKNMYKIVDKVAKV